MVLGAENCSKDVHIFGVPVWMVGWQGVGGPNHYDFFPYVAKHENVVQ